MSKYEYLTCVVTSTESQINSMGFERRRKITQRTFIKNVKPNRHDFLKIIKNNNFSKGIYHGKPCYCRSEFDCNIIYTYIYTLKGE